MISRALLFVAVMIVPLLLSVRPAYAYIDPGSTNFLVQMLLGGLFAAALGIATFWRRIQSFFGNLFSRKRD